MPFHFRRGADEYMLCWRLEDCNVDAGRPTALSFDDETDAFYFLRGAISDSGIMHDLRQWLLSESRSFLMFAIEDSDLMAQTARMIASGELAIATAGGAGSEGVTEAGERGILRKGSAGMGSLAAAALQGTTPLQDETAHREQTAVVPEAVEPPEEEPPLEEEPELAATVQVEPPPELGARAEVEEHPHLSAEAEAGEPHVLATETAIEDVASEVLTETSAEHPPAVDTRADIHEPPSVDTHLDVDHPHDDEEKKD